MSETLMAIMQGISDAQPTAKAPSQIYDRKFVFGFHPPQDVSFDIAVSAKRSGAIDKGLKLEVFSAGVNAKSEKGTESSTVSRILFTVPTIPQEVQDA